MVDYDTVLITLSHQYLFLHNLCIFFLFFYGFQVLLNMGHRVFLVSASVYSSFAYGAL